MKKTILLIAPLALILMSCNKKGCTDSNANNYSEEATKDDGNCTYSATVTFWYQQNQYIQWDQAGVTSLEVEVGGVSIGTYSPDTYFVSAPDCAMAGTINTTKNLGSETSKSLDWVFKDQNGATLKSGTWAATGGGCDVIQVQ